MEKDEFNPEVIEKSLKDISEKLKPLAETALAESKKAGDMSVETKGKVDELLVKQGELQARLQAAEQKLDDRKESGPPAGAKSVGQQLAESEEFAAWARKGSTDTFKMQVKAITSLPASAGEAIFPQNLPGIVIQPQQQFYVRDLIAPGTTSSNSIQYVRESGWTNLAAPVSETTLKPESDITYELLTAPVITIAHWIKASKQVLDDFKALGSMIDAKLRYGLKIVEDAQLLKGSGSGNNLNGIYTQATAYSAPAGAPASPTVIDTLRLMALQVELAEYSADGFVIHPTTWALIELTKDNTLQYLFANPLGIAGPRLWGRPVVSTIAMTVDTALTGAFKLGAQVFDREQANVMISTEDRDNFVTNMITARGEERIGLAVTRPEAFVKNSNLPAFA